MGYREELLDSYLSTHAAVFAQPSRESLTNRFPFYRRYFLRHLPADRAAAIVDVGCGYGSLVEFLRQEGFTNVLGVDVSLQQVDAAHQLGVQGISHDDLVGFLGARPE